jgi:hypothetical protein
MEQNKVALQMIGKHPFLVEVKPAVTQQDYAAATLKIDKFLTGQWNYPILIVGASPRVAFSEIEHTALPLVGVNYCNLPESHLCDCCGDPLESFIGWLGRWSGHEWQYHPSSYFNYGDAPQKKYGIWEHFYNTHHPRCPEDSPSQICDRSEIDELWAMACNATKWQPENNDREPTTVGNFDAKESEALRILTEELNARRLT